MAARDSAAIQPTERRCWDDDGSRNGPEGINHHDVLKPSFLHRLPTCPLCCSKCVSSTPYHRSWFPVPGKACGAAGIPDQGHADDLQASASVANPDSWLEKWHTGTKGDSGCGRFLRPIHIAAAASGTGRDSVKWAGKEGRGGETRLHAVYRNSY